MSDEKMEEVGKQRFMQYVFLPFLATSFAKPCKNKHTIVVQTEVGVQGDSKQVGRKSVTSLVRFIPKCLHFLVAMVNDVVWFLFLSIHY